MHPAARILSDRPVHMVENMRHCTPSRSTSASPARNTSDSLYSRIFMRARCSNVRTCDRPICIRSNQGPTNHPRRYRRPHHLGRWSADRASPHPLPSETLPRREQCTQCSAPCFSLDTRLSGMGRDQKGSPYGLGPACLHGGTEIASCTMPSRVSLRLGV